MKSQSFFLFIQFKIKENVKQKTNQKRITFVHMYLFSNELNLTIAMLLFSI